MAARLAFSIASIFIFLNVFIRDGGCSPTGVPVTACEDTSSSIGHDGVQPQTTPSPFITRANQVFPRINTFSLVNNTLISYYL